MQLRGIRICLQPQLPVYDGGDVAKASSISHIPVWIFSGAEDAAVNSILSLDMDVALTK